MTIEPDDSTSQVLAILLVDDDPLFAENMAVALRSPGHIVDLAADGEVALRRLQTQRYQVIITDYSMPHMAGDELARRIRNGDGGEWSKSLPVFLLTGASKMNREFDRAYFQRIFDKPIDLLDIIRALNEVSPPSTKQSA